MQITMILQHCLLLSLLLSFNKLPTLATYVAPKHYIVYLGSHHEEPRLLANPENITKLHHELISSVLRSGSKSSERIIYSYNKIYNGFAATLHEEEANELAKHPSVASIFESQIIESTTTRSVDFLGLHYPPSNLEDSIWQKSNFGEDVIIANVDTGVWPELQSFSDDESYGPIPKKFKGICEHKYDPAFKCNRKLIGARYFYKAMEKLSNSQKNCSFSEKLSPRDDKDGHGTHTLSTAGGNIIPFASWGGLANGTAKGTAPKARLVAYKTVWYVQCPTFQMLGKSNEIDIVAAFEAAIDDNVDIINFSQGAPSHRSYFDDGIGIATFHAMKNGILTIAAVGNIGPTPETVANNYPWVLSVGASTIDRVFSAHVLLSNQQKIEGTRYYDVKKKGDPNKLYPLITGTDARIPGVNISDASTCQQGTLDVEKVTGKILVCKNAGRTVGSDETSASIVASEAGAVGMIFIYEEKIGDGASFSQIHEINTIVLRYKEGETLFSHINSTRALTALISGVTNTLGVKPSPYMGFFSSRGPNKNTPGILKPDVTAPGVDILAACPPSLFQYPYCILTGSSMAAPHVTGIAALIKKLHPNWSTASIKSAIMTTASPLDYGGKPIRDSDKTSEATPFAYGSGHIKPNMAMDPGLVYDMNQYDYLNFLCAYHNDSSTFKEFSQKHSYKCPSSFNILDFNYPSISIVNFTGNAVVTRKLKNVGQPGTYVPRIEPPPGVSIAVEPKTLVFSHKDQTIMFKLTFTADINHLSTDYIFGSLVWSDAKHVVRSPIMVKAKNK